MRYRREVFEHRCGIDKKRFLEDRVAGLRLVVSLGVLIENYKGMEAACVRLVAGFGAAGLGLVANLGLLPKIKRKGRGPGRAGGEL